LFFKVKTALKALPFAFKCYVNVGSEIKIEGDYSHIQRNIFVVGLFTLHVDSNYSSLFLTKEY